MNYELAKKLKDAGFVYNQKKKLLTEATYLGGYEKVYAPSKNEILSSDYELIEECKDKFGSLERFLGSSNKDEYPTWQWIAIALDVSSGSCSGKTPEEAVANLWLKLNK